MIENTKRIVISKLIKNLNKSFNNYSNKRLLTENYNILSNVNLLKNDFSLYKNYEILCNNNNYSLYLYQWEHEELKYSNSPHEHFIKIIDGKLRYCIFNNCCHNECILIRNNINYVNDDYNNIIYYNLSKEPVYTLHLDYKKN